MERLEPVICRALLVLALVAAPAAVPATSTRPADNTYVHPGTQFPFPEKLPGFTRIEVTKYAPDESDISAGYNSDDKTHLMAATIYIFPAPHIVKAASETPDQTKSRQFELALATVKKEITGVHPDAKTLAEVPFTLKEGGRTHTGVKVTYEMGYNFGTVNVPTTSDMFLFVEGDWQFEYRFSYPKADAAQRQASVEKLMATLTWQAQ